MRQWIRSLRRLHSLPPTPSEYSMQQYQCGGWRSRAERSVGPRAVSLFSLRCQWVLSDTDPRWIPPGSVRGSLWILRPGRMELCQIDYWPVARIPSASWRSPRRRPRFHLLPLDERSSGSATGSAVLFLGTHGLSVWVQAWTVARPTTKLPFSLPDAVFAPGGRITSAGTRNRDLLPIVQPRSRQQPKTQTPAESGTEHDGRSSLFGICTCFGLQSPPVDSSHHACARGDSLVPAVG